MILVFLVFFHIEQCVYSFHFVISVKSIDCLTGCFCDGGRTGANHGAWAELQLPVWVPILLHPIGSQQAGQPRRSAEAMQSQHGNLSLSLSHVNIYTYNEKYNNAKHILYNHGWQIKGKETQNAILPKDIPSFWVLMIDDWEISHRCSVSWELLTGRP